MEIATLQIAIGFPQTDSVLYVRENNKLLLSILTGVHLFAD